MDTSKLIEFDRHAVKSVDGYPRKRFIGARFEKMPGRPFAALVGPRGSGKTVLLRQMRSATPQALYLSADTMDRRDDLFEVVKTLHESYRVQSFFIDEINYLHQYPKALKQIFDFLPVEVRFTSSVSLSLSATAWDLSRRVELVRIAPFSFREYLCFRANLLLAPLGLSDLIAGNIPDEHLRTAPLFHEYLTGGLYPFTLESGKGLEAFRKIMRKVVESDIPSSEPGMTVEDRDALGRTLSFIGKSPIDGVNYSSLSANVGITKYKAQRYVGILEQGFLLRRAFPAGTNVLREPKVFLELPYRLLFARVEDCIGALREDFFALAMDQHGVSFQYAKSTRGAKTPDFLLDLGGAPVVVDVGGKGRGRSQFKGFEYGRKIVLSHATDAARLSGGRVPLHCIGFPAG
jgi:hypothetical protein